MRHLTEKVVGEVAEEKQGTWNCLGQGSLSKDEKIRIKMQTHTKCFHIISTV